MSIIKDGSLTQIQQLHATIKIAAIMKRQATEEARHLARLAAVEREVVGRSVKLAPRRGSRDVTPDFATPAKRKKEYRSSTGLRAFHFGWSSVSKSSSPRGESGTRIYANAAANHIVYIEDGAIARQGHTVYIDSSRVETLADGERLVLSNISDRYEERVEFFRLVDQFERINRGDTVDIDFTVNSALWQSATADPECDPAVVAACADWATDSELAKRQAIALLGSGSELRVLMAKHGFVFTDPVSNKERLKRDGFCFHDGRGGRTEYRLVFELPREFDREQRARALELLCRRFDEAGCMYVAVIHAPDPHNDQDNYHIHLDFYDRRCRRLDGSERDLENVKPQFRPYIAAEMKGGRFREEVRGGAWDFTVKRTYQSNKKKKTHRPFGAANKSKPLRDREFVTKVREDFAEDVNAVARDAGMGELYDPRDYAAMGINRPTSNKLGPKKHGQETKGIPTTTGIDNEAAQAEFQIRMIEQAYQDRCRRIDEIQLRWQTVSQQAPGELSARRAVEDQLARARQATEIRRDLDHLELERERERSRARVVSERQRRASRTGSSVAQARSAALAQAADDYVTTLDTWDLALVAAVAELEPIAAAHGPEQVAAAVLEFEREVIRLEAGRKSEPPSNEPSPPIRRYIMVKRGALGNAGARPHKPGEMSHAAPTRAAQPSAPVEVADDPTEPAPSPASTIQPSDSEAFGSGSAGDRSSDLSIPEHLAVARTDEAPAPEGHQQPLIESSARPTRIGGGSRTSLLVENVPPQATAGRRNDPAESVEPPAPHLPGIEPEISNANSPSALVRVQPLPKNGPGAAPASSRTCIHSLVTKAEIEEILRPRLVGPDGDFKPQQDLDPITAAKLIWAYGDLSPSARARLRPTEQDLYAKAEQRPLADQLRAALVRGRTKHREGSGEARPGPIQPHRQPEGAGATTERAKQSIAQLQAALHAQQGKGGI
jgi:hypothetical protein